MAKNIGQNASGFSDVRVFKAPEDDMAYLTRKNQHLENALITCEKKLSSMTSIPPGTSFFQEGIGMAGLGTRGPDLSDEDLCIGHSMSMTYGSYMNKLKNVVKSPYPIKDIYECMLRATRAGFDHDQLFSFHLNNIRQHATYMYLYKTDSKTYIWYTNPWGHKQDLKQNERDRRVFRLDDPYTQHSTWHDVLHSMSTSANSRKIGLAVEAYALVHEPDFFRMMANWAPGARDHIITTIYLLKLIVEKRNGGHTVFEILHPTQSMPAKGAQAQGNSSYEITKQCDMKLGACTVWSELYKDWATVVLQSVQGDEKGVRRVIYETLPANVRMSVKEVRYVLGKYYFHKFAAEASQNNRRDMRNLLAYYSGFYQAIGISADPTSITSIEEKVLRARTTALESLRQIGREDTANQILMEFFRSMGADRFVELETLAPVVSSSMAKIILNTCILLVGCKHSGSRAVIRDSVVADLFF